MSSASAPGPLNSPPLSAYGALWGPTLISVFISAILYGISVLQTFFYYSSHGKRDRKIWLFLVAVIFVFDTASMGLVMAAIYYYTVMSWGTPEMMTVDVIAFPYEYIITTILVFLVQNFYINTIRALGAHWVFTVALFLASLLAMITGFILPALQLEIRTLQIIVDDYLNHLAFNIARASALGCDLGIVAVLCYLFVVRKTEVRRANNMLDALIMFSVQRGVLQAIVQSGEVIAYAVVPRGVLFLPFHIIVSRIYCNSFLATLNSRQYVLSRGLTKVDRKRVEASIEVDAPNSSGSPHSSFAAPRRGTEEVRSSAPGTHAVFSSMLDPPFLFTASDGGSFHYDVSDRSGTDQARNTSTNVQQTRRYSSSMSRPSSRREDLVSTFDHEGNPVGPPGISTYGLNLDGSDSEKHSPEEQSPASPLSPDSTRKKAFEIV